MTRRGNGDGNSEGIALDRRDLLRGGAAVGTFALASRIEAFRLVMVAQAQSNEPRLQLGSDYFFDDDGDNLKISHEAQGDIFVYDPTADQITTLKQLSALTTEQIGNERHYANAFSGSDPDARLGAALTAASEADTIYLENETYSTDRSFSTVVKLEGTRATSQGTSVSGTWTITSGARVQMIDVNVGGEIVINGRFCEIHRSQLSASGGSITVSSESNIITGLRDVDVTFESGSSDNIVDSSIRVTVTDNGTNTVGDIA